MLARKMSSGMEQHGLLQSEYLEDLASQETGDQGQMVTRQTVRFINIYKSYFTNVKLKSININGLFLLLGPWGPAPASSLTDNFK